MYIRKKKNKSGVVSIQIIDKSTGAYRVLQTIGSATELDAIELLFKRAEQELITLKAQSTLLFEESEEFDYINSFMNSIETLSLVGPELLLGKLFDEIGFNKIEDILFRYLVITRLIYPVSKLKTTDYLFKYNGLSVSVYSIYRYLDKLHKSNRACKKDKFKTYITCFKPNDGSCFL